MIDFTLFLPDEQEFDWFEAAKECAEYTPEIIKPPLSADELLKRKIARSISNNKYRTRHPNNIKARSALRFNGVASIYANAKDVALQVKTQKDLCWWCGKKMNGVYHVDHRVPLIKGGSWGAGNIVISCPKCNLSKNDLLPHEFNGRLL